MAKDEKTKSRTSYGRGRSKSPAKAPATKRAPSPGVKYVIGTEVSKVFFDEAIDAERPFSGEVTRYDADEDLYLVVYEDGDEEEMDEEDLSKIIVTTKPKKTKRKDKVSKKDEGKGKAKKPRTSKKDPEEDEISVELATTGRTSRRSAKKKVVYADFDSEDNMELEESEEDVPKKNKASNRKASKSDKPVKSKAKKGKGDKKAANDSDGDEFKMGSEPEEDDSFAADPESEMEVEAEDEYVAKKGKKATGKKKQAAGSSTAKKEGKPKKKMSEMFKPTNNPIFWNKVSKAWIC